MNFKLFRTCLSIILLYKKSELALGLNKTIIIQITKDKINNPRIDI